mmetsp:Transcript_5369/g.20278  ORF Transcript_5369/g.20278 Transcript_5369/m.20278 type:complete len:528 (+) Transcript_5369:180-1763(+)
MQCALRTLILALSFVWGWGEAPGWDDPDAPESPRELSVEAVAASEGPFLACRGSAVIPGSSWESLKVLVKPWSDLTLEHTRVVRKILWAINHNDALEEHALDCGFGLAVVLLVSLRAIDYDDGREQAKEAYFYLLALLERLEPYRSVAAELGWGFNTTDLAIYPSLLGLDPPHHCYDTQLKIFVYDLPEKTRGVLHCQHGQWGLEALIPFWLQQGSCATTDPDAADFFLVPWHTWCDRMVLRLNQTRREISNIYMDLMRRHEEFLPHWTRNGGRDHIFIFSDQGMNFFPEWKDWIPHSIFLLTEALTPHCGPTCYNPWKDVLLPGHTDYFRYRSMLSYNRPTEERNLLFNFHGRYPGLCSLYKDNVVRGRIIEIFHGKPGVSVGGFTDDYFERMGLSHFCLVPMGTSSWTNHLYEAFFAGCIPVILSDGFEVPYADVIDWPSLSIKWPMLNVGMDLYYFLLSTPMAELKRMKDLVDAHACWFDYHQVLERSSGSAAGCSPYLGIIRALEKRRLLLHRSPGRFWRHLS